MPFSGFDVFWKAAQALQGQDPYSLPGVYYPLPTFFLFLPLAMIPLTLAWLLKERHEMFLVGSQCVYTFLWAFPKVALEIWIPSLLSSRL